MNLPDGDRLLDTAITAWRRRQPPPGPTLLHLDQSWLNPPEPVEVPIEYRISGDERDPDLAIDIEGVSFSLQDPLLLEPVPVPKPWGQEIWFTGIEARGESRVVGSGGSIGLARYLAAAPDLLCAGEPIVLLKVLDPLPQPVLGELYFEVHERKREVYVVTHIDPDAWPTGTGHIRFGMNQTRRRELGDAAFRAAFLDAVSGYERVRLAIDAGAEDLAAAEAAAREAVHAFTDLRPLARGDVVVVPTWTPHALQHGVRVVEFQTPTYERHIISFGQRVLTQPRWDSAVAIERMSIDPPAAAEFEPITPGIDRIAQFEDFSVWRAVIEPGAALQSPVTFAEHLPYALCMCIAGGIDLQTRNHTLSLHPEQAAFIPRSALGLDIVNSSSNETAILLLAAPGL